MTGAVGNQIEISTSSCWGSGNGVSRGKCLSSVQVLQGRDASVSSLMISLSHHFESFQKSHVNATGV